MKIIRKLNRANRSGRLNIGFVSTRFNGTDGVTLEAFKWGEVLGQAGHSCFWFSGELSTADDHSYLVPEAHFKNAQNLWIDERIWGVEARDAAVTERIHLLRASIKQRLHDFIDTCSIDLLIAENALSIPMNVPLGLALSEAIAETGIPTVAHHHDFYWERSRYAVNGVNDYLHMAFPPSLPNIRHIVINTPAREALALRTGIAAAVIPNVLDFATPPATDEERCRRFRTSIGLDPDDIMILQPTRIIQRKGIEHSIQLVRKLNDHRAKLVISHEAGDEGYDYLRWLTDYAEDMGVDLHLVHTPVSSPWSGMNAINGSFTLWDIYPNADFVTYPSTCEGFGNAFLEAVYFRKPILINRYDTFIRDIEPQEFELIVMDGFLSRELVRSVRETLSSPARRQQMTEANYTKAARLYSYDVLRKGLAAVFEELLPDLQRPLFDPASEKENIVYLRPFSVHHSKTASGEAPRIV